MKISVITCCYNQAHYIKETIDSVLSQTFPNIELVVVNDGSPDNTDEIVAPYTNLSNFVYVKQENTGLGIARNNGINAASGDWIFILDSDDVIEPKYLEKAFNIIKDNMTVVFPKPIFFSEDAILNKTLDSDKLHKQHNEPSFNKCIFHHGTHVSLLVNRDLINKVEGYIKPKDLQQLTDWDISIKLLKAGANFIMFNSSDIKNTRYLYRYHKTSMTRQNFDVNAKMFRVLIKKDLHPDVFDLVLNEEYNKLYNRIPSIAEREVLINDGRIDSINAFQSSITKLNTITMAYRNILKRNPDIFGLTHYYNSDISNINNYLYNSQEYKNK